MEYIGIYIFKDIYIYIYYIIYITVNKKYKLSFKDEYLNIIKSVKGISDLLCIYIYILYTMY